MIKKTETELLTDWLEMWAFGEPAASLIRRKDELLVQALEAMQENWRTDKSDAAIEAILAHRNAK